MTAITQDVLTIKRILPDGPVNLQLWHPEQFLDQPLQRLQLGATPAEINPRLNFVPRKRKSAAV